MKHLDNMRVRHGLRLLAFAAALLGLLVATWWAYHPGLSGAFLFDDLGSLPKLGATGPVDNWATFWRYITSGSADPTGRPLALLSFLIDARNWPTDPYPFKVTNVILHLINGALLAWVLWRLGNALGPPHGSGRNTKGKSVLVIPGPAAGRNPESVSLGAASRDRAISLDESQARQSTDSGSPLRGVRNDEGENAGVRNDGGKNAGVRNDEGKNAGVRNDEGKNAGVWNDEAGLSPGRPNGTAIAIAALFGAGAWLLHPLLVSTTLYVVQREAMLPATFVLIGMLGWMASREALARGHLKRALVGFVLSAWLCTLLAVLSKANGALLPLLLLLTEWIVLSRRPMPDARTRDRHKLAITIFLVVPSVLLIAYLLAVIPGDLSSTPARRGWTVGQRLLTEPRVLTDYLRLLFVPSAHSSGLFNDAFPASTGWLHPGSTLPCVALILGLIGAGLALRKRFPAIALALLFYFAAQIMESGWIPLELYFEHRNYLPAMLLFWPIGLALERPGALRFLRTAAAAAILVVLAMLTAQRAALWGDAPHQARVWAAFNPDSARAQTSAALYDLQNDWPRLAAARLRLAMPRHPDEVQIPVNLITAECKLGAVRPEALTAARTALASDRVGSEVAFNWFGEALALIGRHACKGLDYADMQGLLDAAQRNPYWRDRTGMKVDLYHLQGALQLAQHRAGPALQDFNLALRQSPHPEIALGQAATMAEAGYPKLALAHLDYLATLPKAPRPGFGMQRVHAWVLQRQGYWQHEVAHLRKSLQAAAATTSSP